MTYLQFHFVFTIPLFFLLIFLNARLKQSFSSKSLSGCGLLCFLAFIYTTPWDSYLIRQNIWNYSPENVIGTLFSIPFEEYFFFFIQSVIGCLFTAFLIVKFRSLKSYTLTIKKSHLIGVLILWSLCAIGFFFYIPQNTYRYLFLILFWGFPIIGLQWILGFSILKSEWRVLSVAIFILTIYFWIADSFAINQAIWSFPPNTISGIKFFNILPLEEALFFLMTNFMVVQGYILFTKVARVPFLNRYEWRF